MAFRHLISASVVLFSLAGPAWADVVSIPAVAFEERYPSFDGVARPSHVNGVLKPDGATVMLAPVDFPVGGQICRLTLIYDDENASEDMTAKLMRKKIAIGSDSYAPAQTLAQVSSQGQAGTMQRVSTTNISLPTINEDSFFYYVDVYSPNFNVGLVGVQIVHKTAC